MTRTRTQYAYTQVAMAEYSDLIAALGRYVASAIPRMSPADMGVSDAYSSQVRPYYWNIAGIWKQFEDLNPDTVTNYLGGHQSYLDTFALAPYLLTMWDHTASMACRVEPVWSVVGQGHDFYGSTLCLPACVSCKVRSLSGSLFSHVRSAWIATTGRAYDPAHFAMQCGRVHPTDAFAEAVKKPSPDLGQARLGYERAVGDANALGCCITGPEKLHQIRKAVHSMGMSSTFIDPFVDGIDYHSEKLGGHFLYVPLDSVSAVESCIKVLASRGHLILNTLLGGAYSDIDSDFVNAFGCSSPSELPAPAPIVYQAFCLRGWDALEPVMAANTGQAVPNIVGAKGSDILRNSGLFALMSTRLDDFVGAVAKDVARWLENSQVFRSPSSFFSLLNTGELSMNVIDLNIVRKQWYAPISSLVSARRIGAKHIIDAGAGLGDVFKTLHNNLVSHGQGDKGGVVLSGPLPPVWSDTSHFDLLRLYPTAIADIAKALSDASARQQEIANRRATELGKVREDLARASSAQRELEMYKSERYELTWS